MKGLIISQIIIGILSGHLGWHHWTYFEAMTVILLSAIAWELSE